jgi:hypothetical protein
VVYRQFTPLRKQFTLYLPANFPYFLSCASGKGTVFATPTYRSPEFGSTRRPNHGFRVRFPFGFFASSAFTRAANSGSRSW